LAAPSHAPGYVALFLISLLKGYQNHGGGMVVGWSWAVAFSASAIACSSDIATPTAHAAAKVASSSWT
jgi:hypothetical protein